MSEPITERSIWKEYMKAAAYNDSIQLDDTVRVNENFFIGRQWEGVEANGLPTPVFNFLKRVSLFIVASVTSDNIRMKASPLAAGGGSSVRRASDVLNDQFDSLFEFNRIPNLMREVLRNAAVDGDGSTYTYWDPEAENGTPRPGAIRTEVLQNNRVFFGNPADRGVQSQPYILIKRRLITERVRKYGKAHGCDGAEDIGSDTDDQNLDSYKETGDKTTVLLRLWKDDKTRTVWACEAVKDRIVRSPWDMGLKLYPVTWLNWDYVQDNYHGQALITGLIPNQIYINKAFAMSMISLMTTAYPKIVYDKTRVSKWDNGVGRSIGVNGNVTGVASILDPAQISPQISQFIQLTQEMTQNNLGATSVALGDTRPDNTSAIIALQRAASTPNEITKQNYNQNIEDLGRIYADFLAEYGGVQSVWVSPPDESELPAGALDMAGQRLQRDGNGKILQLFDFSILKNMPMSFKLDVGASSYWSEIASVQTLDNLLVNKQIDIIDYLDRIPDGYVTDREGLIAAIKQRRAQAAGMQQTPEQQAPGQNAEGTGVSKAETPIDSIPVRGGRGNGALQRALTESV